MGTLHSEELRNLYLSQISSGRASQGEMRFTGYVARMGEETNVQKILMGKPTGKRPLGRPRRRWEDGIKMDLRESGWGSGVGSVGSG
jgi:hypothetical protein